MDGRSRRWRDRWLTGWYVVTVALVGLLAAVAVFGRGPARGETYADIFDWSSSTTITTNGIFEVHSAAHTAERVSWDVLTLVVLVPALLVVTSAVARGSTRARIVAAGGLLAVVLQQCAYVGTWSIDSSLALLSLLVLVMAAAGSIHVASPVAGRSLADDLTRPSPGANEPAAPVGTYVALSVLWLVFGGTVIGLVASEFGGGATSPTATELTLVGPPVGVWAVAPVAVAVGVGVWRRQVVGRLLAAILLVTTAFLGLANVVMVIAAWVAGGSARPFHLLVALGVTAVAGQGMRLAQRRLLAPVEVPEVGSEAGARR